MKTSSSETSASLLERGRMRPGLVDFLRSGGPGNVVLVVAVVVALVLANSRWSVRYEVFWAALRPLSTGRWPQPESMRFLVNDGLMTLFFTLVGLEIRSELRPGGALASVRQAGLPVVAALGGMVVPSVLYLCINLGGTGQKGWAIPMATDIALALGVLSLLGSRIPANVRVFLLALATVDDIASMVVGVLNPQELRLSGLPWILAGVVGLFLLRRYGSGKPLLAYGVPAAALWVGALGCGFQPALTGVLVGLLLPPLSSKALQGWVAFGVMPLFALANLGIAVHGLGPGASRTVALGVVLGRVLGKPIGIGLATMAAAGSGVFKLPTGVTWRGILFVGCLGGIGLTVPLYLAASAFTEPGLLEAAKLALLVSFALSAMLGWGVGWVLFPAAGGRKLMKAVEPRR